MACQGFSVAAVVMLCLMVTIRSQQLQQEAYDYCDPSLKLCEFYSDHTMCKYPYPGPSPQCTKGLHEPLNTTEKDRILYWHNKFRSYVANGNERSKTRKLPTSSNMRQMYWDGELEKIAARWADQCTSVTNGNTYDKCRNTKRFRVSQNVGTRRVNGTSIEKQAPQIVITWYKENKDFDPALVDRFLTSDDKISVKQFANIIWADTYTLGCARVVFQEKLPLSDKDPGSTVWTTERLVCNYGPAGNEVGRPIYKRGAPCEKCPSGTDCSRIFPGLCAIQSGTREGARERSDTKPFPQEADTTPYSSVRKEEEEAYPGSSGYPEDREEPPGQCLGGDCTPPPVDFRNRFNYIIRFPQPTARKKSREVGPTVPARRNDFYNEGRKWVDTNNKKDTNERKMKNWDKCECFVRVRDSYSGSSGRYANAFLLLFSASIAVDNSLFSTYHCI